MASKTVKLKCPHCPKCYSNKKILEAHIQQAHVLSKDDEPFKCDQCPQTFSLISNLNRHVKTVHSDIRNFKCDQCDKSFKTQHDLNHHIENVHNNQGPVICHHCGKKFKNKGSLTSHVSQTHRDEEDIDCKCQHCGKTFDTKAKLKKHINNMHNNNKGFKCDHCGRKYMKEDSLNNHIKDKHSGPPQQIKCEKCNITFKQLASLNRHNNINHSGPDEQLKCEHCDKTFRNSYALRDHMKNTHINTDKNHQCEQCPATFNKIGRLKWHIKMVHSDIRKFQCDKCDKSYKTQSDLNQHIENIHDNQGPVVCQHCRQKLKNKSTLESHVRRNHEDNKELVLKCQHCDKTFDNQDYLNRHIKKMHTNNKGFKCDHCGQRFMKKDSLTKHIKDKHSGPPQKFKCDECNITYKTQGSLTRHNMYIHSDTDKQLKCELCDKSCKNRDTLRLHMKHMHLDTAKNFKCKKCRSAFKTRSDLNYHIYNLHDMKNVVYDCPHCDKSLTTIKSLNRHVRDYHIRIGKQFKCERCGKTFRTKYDLGKHVRFTHVRRDVYKCEYCGMKISTPENLKRHIKYIHNNQGPLKCSDCNQEFSSKEMYMSHVRTFCLQRQFSYKCHQCKSPGTYDPTNVLQVLEHAMTCKPNVVFHKCYICHGRFRKYAHLHIQYDLLQSRLFENIPCNFTCTCCLISFPTQQLLNLHNTLEHPCLVTIQSVLESGAGDLSCFKMPPEQRELLCVERERIRDLGMGHFEDQGEAPCHQCYVCHRPFHSSFVHQVHTKNCEKKYRLEESTIASYGPRQQEDDDDEKPRKKEPRLLRKWNSKLRHKILLELTHDVEKNEQHVHQDNYWGKLEHRFNIYPGYLKQWLPDLIKGNADLEDFFKQQPNQEESKNEEDQDCVILPTPVKIPREIVLVDLTSDPDAPKSKKAPSSFYCASCGKKCGSSKELEQHGHATALYFRRINTRRMNQEKAIKKKKEESENVNKPVRPEKDYWNLKLWESNGELPDYKCDCCRRPFHSWFCKQVHQRQCERRYELQVDTDEEDMEIEEPTAAAAGYKLTEKMVTKMKKLLNNDMGNKKLISEIGSEMYWSNISKKCKVPAETAKQLHIGFTQDKRKRKAYFEDMLDKCHKRYKKLKRL